MTPLYETRILAPVLRQHPRADLSTYRLVAAGLREPRRIKPLPCWTVNDSHSVAVVNGSALQTFFQYPVKIWVGR